MAHPSMRGSAKRKKAESNRNGSTVHRFSRPGPPHRRRRLPWSSGQGSNLRNPALSERSLNRLGYPRVGRRAQDSNLRGTRRPRPPVSNRAPYLLGQLSKDQTNPHGRSSCVRRPGRTRTRLRSSGVGTCAGRRVVPDTAAASGWFTRCLSRAATGIRTPILPVLSRAPLPSWAMTAWSG